MQVSIKGITYNILAEIKLNGIIATGAYSHMATLQRPKGNKEFTAMRRKESGVLEIL